MALFFDKEWFDARLKEKNTDRKQFARVLQIEEEQLEEIWKDQALLSPEQVARAATFLNQPKATIIDYAGIASVEKTSTDSGDNLTEVIKRLEKIERTLAELQNMLFAKNLPK